MNGFEILSRLRAVLPHTKSLLMNDEVLSEWRSKIGIEGNGRTGAVLPNLTPAESKAFQSCSRENLRIEQERLPQQYVADRLKEVFGTA